MLPFFLLSRKGISVLIRAVMVAAQKLDSNYCCCFVATEMENGREKKVHFCGAHRRRKKKNKKKSDERWFSMSIIFVTVYEYLKR